MGWRYCPECGQWYETRDYTVSKSGETICRKEDHGAVHGFILSKPTKREFYNNHPDWYEDRDEMFEAAVEQNLIADA